MDANQRVRPDSHRAPPQGATIDEDRPPRPGAGAPRPARPAPQPAAQRPPRPVPASRRLGWAPWRLPSWGNLWQGLCAISWMFYALWLAVTAPIRLAVWLAEATIILALFSVIAGLGAWVTGILPDELVMTYAQPLLGRAGRLIGETLGRFLDHGVPPPGQGG